MESFILYQNSTLTVFVIDIPRSIECGQGFDHLSRLRFISTQASIVPFTTPESQSSKAQCKGLRTSQQCLRDLIISKHLELALNELTQGDKRIEWCLKRITERAIPENDCSYKRYTSMKNKLSHLEATKLSRDLGTKFSISSSDRGIHSFYQNNQSTTKIISISDCIFYMPPFSTTVLGSTESTGGIFAEKSVPQFDIIILDPPWPNRSVRRSREYRVCYNASEIEALLLSIPFSYLLADNGIVAIWVTNKPAIHSLALRLFDQLNLTMIEEWIWLKITKLGEPIFSLTSSWRKPYEILLIGRKVRSAMSSDNCKVDRRVFFGVPDRHSLKPNLKFLFQKIFGFEAGNYMGLEIFARYSSAGWWSWGDEALMFQDEDYWIEFDNLQ